MTKIRYTIRLEIETKKDSIIDLDINGLLTDSKLLNIHNFFFTIKKFCKEVIE